MAIDGVEAKRTKSPSCILTWRWRPWAMSCKAWIGSPDIPVSKIIISWSLNLPIFFIWPKVRLLGIISLSSLIAVSTISMSSPPGTKIVRLEVWAASMTCWRRAMLLPTQATMTRPWALRKVSRISSAACWSLTFSTWLSASEESAKRARTPLSPISVKRPKWVL